jgi:hypothetical protein
MDLRQFKQDDGSLVVTFDGKPLTCVVCANTTFDEKSSVLKNRATELLGLGWADDQATNFVCTKCGYIFWFLF